MGNVLENSLFVQNPGRFQELSQAVVQFNSLYNGNNIIQDDIFSVLANYARKKQEPLELLRFPTRDDDFCALTCVKKERYLSTSIPGCRCPSRFLPQRMNCIISGVLLRKKMRAF